jgi:hypothetical protein
VVRPQRLGSAFGLFLGTFIVVAGCGSKRPPAEGDGTTIPTSSGGNGQTFVTDAGGAPPPGCGVQPNGSACTCTDVALFFDAPTIYFVLDRSLSMADNDKWTQIRIVVGQILRGLGPRAKFGAMMFPGSSAEGCGPGTEVMSIRPGDPPSSGVDGPTTTQLLTVTRVSPAGGTPTAASLQAVVPILRNAGGKAFVILATDGAPNCNPNLACGPDQCQYNIQNLQDCPANGPQNCCAAPIGTPENCNDTSATLAAVTTLEEAGFPTYVLGLPGTGGPYAYILDQMATNGGTAQASEPKYYAVDTASQDAMLAALKKITAQIVGTCTFQLQKAPADPNLVNVYLDDVVLPYEPVNGWSLDDTNVTLLGSACSRVKNGDVLDVRIIAGCPRVEPR